MHRLAVYPSFVLLCGLILVIISGSVDLLLDRPRAWLSFHTFFELLLIAGAITTMTALWLGLRESRRMIRQLAASLEESSSAVDRQFDEWELTPVEREVATGLLRGHSHKHIAKESGRSERTIRQHATAVYNKAGISSRAELAAFFLVALRVPRHLR